MMVVTMFGGGILSIPASFKATSILEGSVMFLIITMFTGFSLYFLCACVIEQKRTESSYYEVCKSSYPIVAIICDVFTAFLGISASLAYLKLITDAITRLFEIDKYRSAILVLIVIICFLLASQKNLSSIAWASYVSIFSVIFLSFFIFYCFLQSKNVQNTEMPKNYSKAFGKIVFALGCQQNMISVYSSLEDQSLFNCTKLILMACAIGPTLYLLVGIFGYLAMGDACDGKNILFILTDKQTIQVNKYLNMAVILSFCLTLICSVAFQMSPAKISIANLLKKLNVSKEFLSSQKYHIILSFTVMLFNAILVFFKVQEETVVNIAGAFAGNVLFYILPSVIFLSIVKKSKMRNFAALTGICGITSLIFCFFSFLKDMFS